MPTKLEIFLKLSSTLAVLPRSLQFAIQASYISAGFELTEVPKHERESKEYHAYRFSLGNKKIVYRDAKTTPTKVGQFVTIWKRPSPSSTIIPFEIIDAIDFIVIGVADTTHVGQFVFDKEVPVRKGLISCRERYGKLAFRIYPPWTHPTVKSAIKAQEWQLSHFFELQPNLSQVTLIRELFHRGTG